MQHRRLEAMNFRADFARLAFKTYFLNVLHVCADVYAMSLSIYLYDFFLPTSLSMFMYMYMSMWYSLCHGIVSKLFQTGHWIHGINLQVDASCKMWGCVAHVCNRSWLSAVEYIAPFCSSFPKPCKIQCLVSDAKKNCCDFCGLSHMELRQQQESP